MSIPTVILHPRRVELALILLALPAAVGCASTADSKAMVAENVQVVKEHAFAVAVHATDSPDSKLFGDPLITAEAFQNALAESIWSSRVFSGVVDLKRAEYLLAVSIRELEKPEEMSLSMRVTLRTDWVLRRRATNEKLWSESIETSATATNADAFALDERLRVAVEEAARENIEAGLSRLSRTQL